MSVISVDGLLVEACTFANTWGTAPGAGIDLEPDGDDQSLVDIVIRNCVFENNEGHEILVYLRNLKAKAPDVSIRFANCQFRNSWRVAHPDHWRHRVPIHLQVRRPRLAKDLGGIEFRNCYVFDSAARPVISFESAPGQHSLRDVEGFITVDGPGEPHMDLGPAEGESTLKLIDAGTTDEPKREPDAE